MQGLKAIAIALFACVFACRAADVKLEPDARWSLEFPELPETLTTMVTGERQPARLTVRLPANYSRDGKFPLFVFLNGGDGGRGDTLPLDHKTVGSNDFICANLPLFKRRFDKNAGGLVSVDDFETISRAYRVMLQKLFDIVPNITPERSAFGGFSNGAHTIALLVAGQDEFILRHFCAFYFVEGGSPLAANALHGPGLKRCRFLLLRGDRGEPEHAAKAFTHITQALEYAAKGHELDFTFITMRDTGHAFPLKYQLLLGQWVRGERLSDLID
jgi:hypothetical protein